MSFDWFSTATQKELDRFKAICNQLLSRTYVVRTVYRPGEGRVNNPDYVFLSTHFEVVRDYLAFLDWDLRKDALRPEQKRNRYPLGDPHALRGEHGAPGHGAGCDLYRS